MWIFARSIPWKAWPSKNHLSLVSQYEPLNLLKERSADVLQMASSSPRTKSQRCSAAKNLLGKSPPRNSLISHGKDMLHLGRICENADSFPPPPIQKNGEWRIFKCPLQKCVIPHTGKRKLVKINFPSIIFEGPILSLQAVYFDQKAFLDPLQSSPHPPRKWLFASCFTRTTMSADGSTMFC